MSQLPIRSTLYLLTALALPSVAFGQGTCVCPQVEMMDYGDGTSLYWAERYTWLAGDNDCSDDQPDPVPYIGENGLGPAAYCPTGPDRCENCDGTYKGDGDQPEKPEQMEVCRYICFCLPGQTQPRYAKVCLVIRSDCDFPIAHGTEVDRIPDGEKLVKVCAVSYPARVYEGNTLTTTRKAADVTVGSGTTAGSMKYFVNLR